MATLLETNITIGNRTREFYKTYAKKCSLSMYRHRKVRHLQSIMKRF